MKKGRCIINGVDIADLGMFILQGEDYDLFSFPQRIEPVQNNWYERDGIDVDLEEVYFKEKKVTIGFYISAENSDLFRLRLERFFGLLYIDYYQDEKYTKLEIPDLNRTFYLRYLLCPKYNHREGLYKSGKKSAEIKVEFSMDKPLQLFTNQNVLTPNISNGNKTYVSLNSYDLSEFGIIVSECYNSVMKLPDVKTPLSRGFEHITGLEVYPSINPRLQSKQIIISCTMLANSREQFFQNYQALFNNINKPEAVTLETYYDDFECYYSDMQNFVKEEFSIQRVKTSFDLVFTIIEPSRPIPILVTQDIIPITTENGLNYIRTNCILK